MGPVLRQGTSRRKSVCGAFLRNCALVETSCFSLSLKLLATTQDQDTKHEHASQSSAQEGGVLIFGEGRCTAALHAVARRHLHNSKVSRPESPSLRNFRTPIGYTLTGARERESEREKEGMPYHW